MADNPNPEIEEAKPKRKGVKRRLFLFGGLAVVGGGMFGIHYADSSAAKRAIALTTKKGEASFATWLKIAEDDTLTIYSPHIDFGQGAHTALAQMAADELDADWSKVRTEQAPADGAFANTPLTRAFGGQMAGAPGLFNAMPTSFISLMARSMPIQITGGSSAVRATGQFGMRVAGAATRLVLIEEAAERLGVPASELTTENSKVIHAKSGKSLRYGELATKAAERSLESEPKLKDRKHYKLIGQSISRLDIPGKVDGTAQYGIDVNLPDMRVATSMLAPIRDGNLTKVDAAPAMAVKGVEKVIQLDDTVVVVAKGYWQAQKGLQALEPQFSDGGHSKLSTASIFEAQDKLRADGSPTNDHSEGDVDAAFVAKGAKVVEAKMRTPFLHQMMMEPFAMVAHHKDGKLEMWGGLQDPLATRNIAAEAAGLSADDVKLNTTLMGGGFGRRAPSYCQIIGQAAKIAMQLPYPVKLIWSREEEVRQGAYRPQTSANLKAALGANGKITAWQSDYAQFDNAGEEAEVPYTIPSKSIRHYEYISNQVNAFWRSVNASQHGFYNETMIDDLAKAAGQDPFEFRMEHLPAESRHRAALAAVAQNAGWSTPVPEGRARGIAIVESFGTIVAEVVEASLKPDGAPKVHKVFAVVDCGTTVNPLNAAAQIEGGIIMGLSAAIGEEITLESGAVQQSNFSDYEVMKMADTPEISVQFIDSGAPIGGIGEPGLPPAAPALANALFALTGKRIVNLPIRAQAAA